VTSAAIAPRRDRPWFFSVMGGVALLAVAIGFGRTYAVPVARHAFSAPLVVHIHGAFALSWVLLFVLQPLLLRSAGVQWHRRVGRAGLPLAVAVALTMLPAGVVQATRDAAAGAGPTGISSVLGVVATAVMFVAFVAAGIWARRDRESHARWMLLATLLVIWPAWFRFRHWFPAVPRPDVWFGVVLADVWIVVAMARDWVTRGAVHPVLAWAGSGVIVEQSLEAIAFDSAPWRLVAQWIYDVLRAAGA
jgi:hypothetical protein